MGKAGQESRAGRKLLSTVRQDRKVVQGLNWEVNQEGTVVHVAFPGRLSLTYYSPSVPEEPPEERRGGNPLLPRKSFVAPLNCRGSAEGGCTRRKECPVPLPGPQNHAGAFQCSPVP